MGIYDEWKKDIEKKIEKYTKKDIKEKIPAIIKRCPKCMQLTLEYDPKTGKIHCKNCGFQEHIPMTKEAKK